MIEEVSYWSTFSTARQVLDEVRTRTAHRVLEVVQKTAAELVALGAGTTHALASRVFQWLIADRKFLASYYKRAALLTALLARRLGRDWSGARTYEGLTVGDPACGTGTLLHAGYEAVGGRMRRAGLDDAALHRRMMEEWSTSDNSQISMTCTRVTTDSTPNGESRL